MVVNLRKIAGFDFILQPIEFNAWQCRGGCPPRFNPAHDHSLLQSLMHVRAVEEARVRSSRGRPDVRRPCCAPSRLESLDILHLDDTDAGKLKITRWRNIVVGECACS